MIINSKYFKSKYKPHFDDLRIKKKYAWLPKYIAPAGDTEEYYIWLSNYYEIQRYKRTNGRNKWVRESVHLSEFNATEWDKGMFIRNWNYGKTKYTNMRFVDNYFTFGMVLLYFLALVCYIAMFILSINLFVAIHLIILVSIFGLTDLKKYNDDKK